MAADCDSSRDPLPSACRVQARSRGRGAGIRSGVMVGRRITGPGSPACGPATASSSPSTSPADRAGCAAAGCSPSARPPRSVSRAREPRSSATPRSTGQCPAARRSTCGAAGSVRADQDPAWHAGRAVPVPVRHPAHRLPGRRLRQRPRRRDARRARSRAGGAVRGPDRQSARGGQRPPHPRPVHSKDPTGTAQPERCPSSRWPAGS
jgi:hypothetical protein